MGAQVAVELVPSASFMMKYWLVWSVAVVAKCSPVIELPDFWPEMMNAPSDSGMQMLKSEPLPLMSAFSVQIA